MTERGRRRIAIGTQVRRWRTERALSLPRVAERSGLDIGYLAQIEGDEAAPSLDALAALAAALDVPPAWLLLEDAPAPRVVRGRDRTSQTLPGGAAAERADGGASRGMSILHVKAAPGTGTGEHSHPGEEHHVVLQGRWLMRQGEHEVELGPGDYLAWDGTSPHDAEVVGTEPGEMLIVSGRAERGA